MAKIGFDRRAKGPACGPCGFKKLRGHRLSIWPWRDLRLLVSNINRNYRAARITLMLLYWQSNVEHFWLFVIKKFGKSHNYLFSSYFEREEEVRQSLFPSFFFFQQNFLQNLTPPLCHLEKVILLHFLNNCPKVDISTSQTLGRNNMNITRCHLPEKNYQTWQKCAKVQFVK